MKKKALIASLAACTVAITAMAIPASAEKTILNANNDGAYLVDLAEAKVPYQGGISGAVATITLADGWNESGAGGGFIFQGDGVAWGDGAKEWGITGEGTDAKNIEGITPTVSGNTLTLKYDFGKAIFSDTAEWGQCIIQAWWGSDFTVDKIEYLDLEGKVIGAAADAPSGETTAAPAATTAAPSNETQAPSASTTAKPAGDGQTSAPTTGDAGVGVAVAALGLAGVAAFVTRKKK